jgi:hypothetical protein
MNPMKFMPATNKSCRKRAKNWWHINCLVVPRGNLHLIDQNFNLLIFKEF